jgi:valyl-tRNA synthetase
MEKIELDKTYSPKSFEERLYKEWEASGAFEPAADNGLPPFVMVIPPPNVTGVLHMGHGLNNALQDILARYHRMSGRPTLWVPGTDHAGIATQHVVEKELIKKETSRRALGREAFIKETWKVKERHHAVIIDQLKKIGCCCDWSRERFTLDDTLSKAVNEVFVTLYERGLIYRGEYLVNWCSSCGTAIADDEVEHHEEKGFLYYINYAVAGESGRFLTVATTRPETLFGDAALAVHPDDERYKQFIGQTVTIPLTDRKIPVIADSYVDREYGTAVLKITPAHDPNDNAVGRRHALPLLNILNADGTLNASVPPAYQNLKVAEARVKVAADLEKAGLLIKKEAIQHRVGRCYRCDTVIEPYMSRQWFVKMAPLAEKALKAWEKGDIRFYPKRWENTYKSWLAEIRDWCISRQLWWGHRIPAWHCGSCGEVIVSRTAPDRCAACGSEQLHQDDDVLDTWFSSWLWPFSTLGWPQQTDDLKRFYPTSSLVTAYDIIFFWVARMIMAGLEFTGQVPFTDIYITPLVRDKEGRKMSKSLGNGINPLEVVDEYGADALKFTIAYLSSQSQDLPLDKESFAFGSRFCNKIWNASRYLLMNLDGIELVNDPALNSLDQWAYSRLNNTAALVKKAVEEYRFDDMAHAVYDYFWNDFCDWYIEGSKISLYSDSHAEKNRAATVALALLEESLRLLHPFVPFISEEIFSKLPNKSNALIITARYPEYSESRSYTETACKFEKVQAVITATRTLRSENKIPPEKKIRMAIAFDQNFTDGEFIREAGELIKLLTKASELTFIKSAGEAEGAVNLNAGEITVFVFARDFINIEAERARVAKELAKLEAARQSAETKLANKGFTEKAPEAAVQKERDKLADTLAAIEKLQGYEKTLR